MEHAPHHGLVEPHYFALCHCPDRCNATGLTDQATFTQEIPVLVDCDHGFLATLGHNGDLALAVPDVKDRIGRIALSEDDLILSISRYRLPPVRTRQERFKIEGLLSSVFHEVSRFGPRVRQPTRVIQITVTFVGKLDYPRRYFLRICLGEVKGGASPCQMVAFAGHVHEALPIKDRDLPSSGLDQICSF